MTAPDPAGPLWPPSKPVRRVLFVVFALLFAIVVGVSVGALFARHELLSTPRAERPVPGEFAPAGPRPVGVPSTPVPIPAKSAPLAIGFLDEQTDVAVPRRSIRTKVGECVVARVQPRHGSVYQRLVGGERWAIAGHPSMEIRPGDAPGYCLTWNRPSGKRGYVVSASAVVADDAGRQANGSGSARVIVQGTPKPKKAGGASNGARAGHTKPQPQARPDDQ